MILIIGGCGYVGTALHDYLTKDGFEVHSVDLELFGKTIPDNNKVDFDSLSKEFLKKYNTIILSAAHSSVPMCKNAIDTHKNNVTNFINLLDKIDGQKLIYFSSSSVYHPLHEAKEFESLPEPINYYDLTKREIDYYAMFSDKDVIGLRPGTINGFSRNLRVDVMINKMFWDAKALGRIEVYNVNSFRPILDINDLCVVVSHMIESKKDKPEIYNLASFNAKIGEVAIYVSKELGVDVIYKGETPAYDFSIDSSKAMKRFGWFSESCFHPKEATISIVEGLMAEKPNYYGAREQIDYPYLFR